MPWTNQSGGGNGKGGGGPWGRGPGGPWGSGGGGGNQPPDLEDILRRGQDRLRRIIPGGGRASAGRPIGGRGALLIALAALVVWLATGIYTVAPNQVGINTVFGRYTGQTREGLRYNFPYPIGVVIKPNVGQVNSVQVGYRPAVGPNGRVRDVPEESLMLTGDENIIDIDFDVQWRVNPAKAEDFVFNLQNPEGTIKAVAESAMREVMGRRQIQAVLTTEQSSVASEVREIMQHTLDSYGAGVLINVVQLQGANPPAEVRQSFYDVNAAQQDAVRVQNEAETYASREVPNARGRSAQIVQQAEAYREQSVAEATGQAARFRQVYDAYRTSPDIIRERIFLETMERVLGSVNKVIVDQPSGGAGLLSVLPLGEGAAAAAAGRPAPSAGAAR